MLLVCIDLKWATKEYNKYINIYQYIIYINIYQIYIKALCTNLVPGILFLSFFDCRRDQNFDKSEEIDR